MTALGWVCLVIIGFEILLRVENSEIANTERVIGVALNVPVAIYIILVLFK